MNDMAVDIKTLRVGSHISIDGERVEVESLQGGDLVGCITPDNDWFATESWRFEPISITPELLAELGFQYRDNTYWERWFLGSFDIERKEGSSYFDYNSEIRLEYLNELEDLYYLIYGVELIKE